MWCISYIHVWCTTYSGHRFLSYLPSLLTAWDVPVATPSSLRLSRGCDGSTLSSLGWRVPKPFKAMNHWFEFEKGEMNIPYDIWILCVMNGNYSSVNLPDSNMRFEHITFWIPCQNSTLCRYWFTLHFPFRNWWPPPSLLWPSKKTVANCECCKDQSRTHDPALDPPRSCKHSWQS